MQMFSEPIELYDAVITAVSHKVKDGGVNSRLIVLCTLSPGLAEELDAASLVFAANGTPKEGFDRLELSTGCASFRAIFEAPKQVKQSFEMNGDSVNHMSVDRKPDGILQLRLRLNYHGDPHTALGFVMAVGSMECLCKIIPLQRELEEAEKAPVKVVKAQEPTMPAKEAARQAMSAATKHAAAKPKPKAGRKAMRVN